MSFGLPTSPTSPPFPVVNPGNGTSPKGTTGKVGLAVCVGPGRFDLLSLCLESILAQTRRPDTILIYDDQGEADRSKQLELWCRASCARYVKNERERPSGNCSVARHYAFEALTEYHEWVVAVDSDDYVPPDYVERLLESVEDEKDEQRNRKRPPVAVYYPKIQMFGARNDRLFHDQSITEYSFDRTNVAASTSLIRSCALRQIGGWPICDVEVRDDWACWRLLQELGWGFYQAYRAVYFWRRWPGSVSWTSPNHQASWGNTVDPTGLVTVASPLVGREFYKEWYENLDDMTWRMSESKLLFVVNDSNFYLPNFDDLLVSWNSVTVARDGTDADYELSNRGVAEGDRQEFAQKVTDRVAGVWNKIRNLVDTPLIFCVEDDVFPEPATLAKLIARMGPETDAVCAPYLGRNREWCVWDELPDGIRPKRRGVGLESADGCGFGCLLIRREVFKSITMTSEIGSWYDVNFWREHKRRGGNLLVDWNVSVEHRV